MFDVRLLLRQLSRKTGTLSYCPASHYSLIAPIYSWCVVHVWLLVISVVRVRDPRKMIGTLVVSSHIQPPVITDWGHCTQVQFVGKVHGMWSNTLEISQGQNWISMLHLRHDPVGLSVVFSSHCSQLTSLEWEEKLFVFTPKVLQRSSKKDAEHLQRVGEHKNAPAATGGGFYWKKQGKELLYSCREVLFLLRSAPHHCSSHCWLSLFILFARSDLPWKPKDLNDPCAFCFWVSSARVVSLLLHNFDGFLWDVTELVCLRAN